MYLDKLDNCYVSWIFGYLIIQQAASLFVKLFVKVINCTPDSN